MTFAVGGTGGNKLFPSWATGGSQEAPGDSQEIQGRCIFLSALGVGAFDVHAFFMDIGVAHQDHERAFSSTGREKGLCDFVTQVTLVIVPSVLRREKCSLGLLVRSEQL